MNEIIKKNGVTYGLLLGIFSILVTAAIYAIDLKLFIKPWIGIVSIVVSISIGIILVSKTKNQMGNITFKEAFTVYFIAALIGNFLSTLFTFVLFNFIDPQAKETLKEITMKYTAEMFEKFGTPASVINETMKKLAETDNYSLGNLFFAYIISLVFGAILGLILAAIFKSKSPSSQGL